MNLEKILRKATSGAVLLSLALTPGIATAKRGDYFLLEQENALPYSTGIAAPQPIEGKKKRPCPPYICPDQGNFPEQSLPIKSSNGAKPAYISPSQEKPIERSEKDSADYLWGSLALLGGTAMIIFGTNKMTICQDDKIGIDESSCTSEIPPFGYILMGSGAAVDIIGLYYMFR
ncbi:MAG TPA: hypothetical protein VJG31_02915 [Candidatus Nanoarchaeia archaeon]|nr:hypothetical protein [Candidatus Nanoarchaeia archaeon]